MEAQQGAVWAGEVAIAVGVGVVKPAPAIERKAGSESANIRVGCEGAIGNWLEASTSIDEDLIRPVDADVGDFAAQQERFEGANSCLLYTSDAADE